MKIRLVAFGRRPVGRSLLVPTALLVALVGGCAPAIRSGAESATKGVAGAAPAIADAGLTTLEDQPTRARVAALLDTPEMRQSLQELSAGIAEGVVMGLSSDAMTAHIDKLVAHFMTAIVGGIDRTFDAMLTPEHEARIAQLTTVVIRASMRAASEEISTSVAPAMHRAIVDDLGPAIHEAMKKDVAAGFADMMRSPEVQKGLGEATHQIAVEAVLGSDEGLAQLAEKKKQHEGGSPMSSLLLGRTWLLALLVVMLALGIPLVWLLLERRRAARYRAEADRRNARASALLAAMEASGDPHWSKNVLALLREQLLESDVRAGDHHPPEGPPPSRRPRAAGI